MNFSESQPSGEGIYIKRRIKDVRFGRFAVNGELSHIRNSFYEIPRSPEMVSQDQPPCVVEIFRGEGDNKISVNRAILTTFQIDRGIWAYPELVSREDFFFSCKELVKLNPGEFAEIAADRQKLHRVSVGRGERTHQNIVEEFYFGILPPEVASIQDERVGLNSLAKWVLDLIVSESDDALEKLKAESNARAVEQLEKFPRRLPHEKQEVDHYKNQQDVLKELLRREWPHLFAATDKLKLAKSESEIAACKKQSWLAYIADHKLLFGSPPTLPEDEAAELWRDENYLQLMSDVLNSKKGNVDKRDWQLACGWITNNYYRMNEDELEVAFNRDWKGMAQKGSALRKRAERMASIGLITALQRGRPEIRKFDDSAL
jgi:hypothetical protein